MLDRQDRQLLRQWLYEPDQSLSSLADRCAMSPAQLTRRIAKLRDDKILLGQHARINWTALGYEVEVSLRVTLDKAPQRVFDEFIAAARAIPEVIEIQTFLGRVDVRLAVITRSLQDYQRLYRDHILALPHIADIEALMHVARVKTETGLPI